MCNQTAMSPECNGSFYEFPDYIVIEDAPLPLSFRISATVLHALIFCVGSVGNVLLIYVAQRAIALRTPTYIYLLSLAYADLLVICCAIPEAILSYHVGNRWVLGQPACAIFIFLNFLGINAGSLSILAFTIERFIAICRPLLARKLCTVKRTKRIVLLSWLGTTLYCCPWLGLTELKPDEGNPAYSQCRFRLSVSVYLIFFLADLVLFYIVPLAVAVVLYTRISRIVKRRGYFFRREDSGKWLSVVQLNQMNGYDSPMVDLHQPFAALEHPEMSVNQSGKAVQQMLIVVVVLFAVSWLPFRGMLVYNSFADEPWLDIWYMLFAKTLIYLNSAINPFLYNFMSHRFKAAVRQCLFPDNKKAKVLATVYRNPLGSTASNTR
ncbi:thyrotropin-releasing hormone receptor-like [Paramacrobiotus metropolitanus]|uniref:thyrotropin-releasing hormone receptor-like n=1 Tax=Paramacrobiotus metropolitanus TaxID=2943436 RepID=UPI002445DE37|nr:thyrotropin-releasing hormone receptor-like [Paramacrobiotus metropolitanus]